MPVVTLNEPGRAAHICTGLDNVIDHRGAGADRNAINDTNAVNYRRAGADKNQIADLASACNGRVDRYMGEITDMAVMIHDRCGIDDSAPSNGGHRPEMGMMCNEASGLDGRSFSNIGMLRNQAAHWKRLSSGTLDLPLPRGIVSGRRKNLPALGQGIWHLGQDRKSEKAFSGPGPCIDKHEVGNIAIERDIGDAARVSAKAKDNEVVWFHHHPAPVGDRNRVALH